MTPKMTMRDVILLLLLHDLDATAEEMQSYLEELGHMPTKFRVGCMRSDVRMTLKSLDRLGLLRDDVDIPPLPKQKRKRTKRSTEATTPDFYYR